MSTKAELEERNQELGTLTLNLRREIKELRDAYDKETSHLGMRIEASVAREAEAVADLSRALGYIDAIHDLNPTPKPTLPSGPQVLRFGQFGASAMGQRVNRNFEGR